MERRERGRRREREREGGRDRDWQTERIKQNPENIKLKRPNLKYVVSSRCSEVISG